MKKSLSMFLVLVLAMAMFVVSGAVVLAQDPPADGGDAVETAQEGEDGTIDATESATETVEAGEEEATEEPAEEATEEPTEEVTEEPTEEATEEPTEEVTEEPTEEVTEEPTEEVTEEPTEEVTEEPTEEVTEEPTEEVTEEPTEEATPEPTTEVITTTPVVTVTPVVTETEVIVSDEEEELSSQSAKTAAYTTKMYIQNPNNASATYEVMFYPDDGGSSTTYSPSALDPYASSILDVSSVSMDDGRYSAVVQSNVELAVVYGQFTSGNAGDFAFDTGIVTPDTVQFLPSLNKTLGSVEDTSVIGIQNTSGSNIDVDVTIFDASGNVQGVIERNGIMPNYAAYVDTSSATFDSGPLAGQTLPDDFLGAAKIEGTGNFVASSQISSEDGEGSDAANAQNGGSNKLFLPTAQRRFGSIQIDSFLAIQNPSDSDSIYYEVKFFDTSGNQPGATRSGTLAPGEKGNASPTGAEEGPGFLGSGTIEAWTDSGKSTPANILGIKNLKPFGNSTTRYSFNAVTGGGNTVAIPFVSWGGDSAEIKTYIAIQNVGSASTDGSIQYYNADGTTATSAISFTNLDPGVKNNTRALDWNGGADFTGTIVVTCDSSPCAALVNAERADRRYFASYTGVPVSTP
jgi:outer membrane biosynthesis protein TonB